MPQGLVMANADSCRPSSDMPFEEAMRLVARLAVLARTVVDVPHARLRDYRLAGFVIEPDEHSVPGEGIEMIRALQRIARMDIAALQLGLMERENAPFTLDRRAVETI